MRHDQLGPHLIGCRKPPSPPGPPPSPPPPGPPPGPVAFSIKAKVPGDVITDLQNAGLIDDPLHELNYKNATLWEDFAWVYSTTLSIAEDVAAAVDSDGECNNLCSSPTLFARPVLFSCCSTFNTLLNNHVVHTQSLSPLCSLSAHSSYQFVYSFLPSGLFPSRHIATSFTLLPYCVHACPLCRRHP